jgi:hypothetical protein
VTKTAELMLFLWRILFEFIMNHLRLKQGFTPETYRQQLVLLQPRWSLRYLFVKKKA